jgi:hypothetical protein
MKNSKNSSLSWVCHCFRERERAAVEEISERPGGAPSQQVGAARAGPRPYVCGGMAAPPGVSQVPLCPIFDIKIYKEFSGIFRETLFSRIFQKLAYR